MPGNDTGLAAIIEGALFFADRSIPVFPLRKPYQRVLGNYCRKKNGKYPSSIFDIRKASCDERTVTQVFRRHPRSNLGVVTGKESGLLVVDIDFMDGGEASMKDFNFPETLTALTGCGLHLYYRHPGDKIPTSAGTLAPGIDIKGDGSYVTAPPSKHYTGKQYRWLDSNAEISDLTEDTIQLLQKLPERSALRSYFHIFIVSNILLPLSALAAKCLLVSRQSRYH